MGLTVGHIIYIPVTILIGAVMGWLLCARIHRVHEIGADGRDAALHEERRAERSARAAKRRAAEEAPAED